MSIRPPRAALLALAVTAACSEYAAQGNIGDSGFTGTAAGTTSGTQSGTTNPTNTPVYFAVSGTLALAGGAVDPTSSTLDLEYRNALSEPICAGVRPLLGAVEEVPTDPDVPLYGLWSLDLGPSPCGDHGPDTLRLGIGAWDDLLTAAADAENLRGPELYGLYLESAPGAAVVFGVSGTSEQFTGAAPPVTAGPLPDGVYQVRTLYLLPLDA